MTPTRVDKCPHCGKFIQLRTPDQNSALHALLTDISQQKQWAGQWLDVEDWKRLMVAAFERANNAAPRIFPSLDGQGIDMIYRRTHRMNKAEMSELIEYATAWAVQNGVRLDREAA